MKQLNVTEYVKAEEAKLKNFAQEQGISDKIKLGIIDTNNKDNNDEIKQKLDDFKRMGWKAAVYKVRDGEKSCGEAIIRAMGHKCTSAIVQLPVREGIDLFPYFMPLFLDCGGMRPDSTVNPIIPQGIVDYLRACEFPFFGKTALLLGRDDVMARLLLEEGMTISICHEKSNPSVVSGLLCDADLVICAMGQPHSVVRTQCLNAVVIDMGIGDFEEKPEFCSDTVWSISNADGVNLLARLTLLKNCACLTNEMERG